MPMKIDLATFNCSLAQTLAIVGDGWSLLIVRDAWLGLMRFGEFQSSLKIAKNILADRLDRLVAGGVLERAGTAKRPTYHLTTRGIDLVPALVALMQWGDKWVSRAPPMRLIGPNGEDILPIKLYAGDTTFDPYSVCVEAGPGANVRTKAFLQGRKTGAPPGPPARKVSTPRGAACAPNKSRSRRASVSAS